MKNYEYNVPLISGTKISALINAQKIIESKGYLNTLRFEDELVVFVTTKKIDKDTRKEVAKIMGVI